jgi:hypothetical protein
MSKRKETQARPVIDLMTRRRLTVPEMEEIVHGRAVLHDASGRRLIELDPGRLRDHADFRRRGWAEFLEFDDVVELHPDVECHITDQWVAWELYCHATERPVAYVIQDVTTPAKIHSGDIRGATVLVRIKLEHLGMTLPENEELRRWLEPYLDRRMDYPAKFGPRLVCRFKPRHLATARDWLMAELVDKVQELAVPAGDGVTAS